MATTVIRWVEDFYQRAANQVYGTGQPAALPRESVPAMNFAPNIRGDGIAVTYADRLSAHTAEVAQRVDFNDRVGRAAALSGNVALGGRKALEDYLTGFRASAAVLAPGTPSQTSALLRAADAAVVDAANLMAEDAADSTSRARQISVLRRSPQRRRVARNAGGRTALVSYGRGGPVIQSDGTLGGAALSAASRYLGTPYVWGGMDCSGLVQRAYRDIGINLPRTTYEQIAAGQRVPLQAARPGDLVFSNFSSRGPEHVQMYAGRGTVIEAPQPGSYVQYSRMAQNAVVIRVV